jgi:hypothetical protein
MRRQLLHCPLAKLLRGHCASLILYSSSCDKIHFGESAAASTAAENNGEQLLEPATQLVFYYNVARFWCQYGTL